jgi:hypothetical protein
MIVGLSGYAQSGKDTFASFLVEDHGFERMAFADPLRDMLYALNPLTWVYALPEQKAGTYNDSVQAIVDQHGWEWAKANTGVRELLQRLGTEAGRRVLGENIWVDTALSKVPLGTDRNIVFTDCRFVNEAEAIRDRGGVIIRIRRPDTSAVNRHPSETALDGYRCDWTVENAGTLDTLRTAATAIYDAETTGW